MMKRNIPAYNKLCKLHIILIAIFLIIAGCQNSTESSMQDNLQVMNVYPMTDFTYGETIKLYFRFSEIMDPSTTSNTILVRGDSIIPLSENVLGTIVSVTSQVKSVAAGNAPTILCTVTIPITVKSISGHSLAQPYVWTFAINPPAGSL